MRNSARYRGVRHGQPLTFGTLCSAVEAAIGCSLPFALPLRADMRCSPSMVVRTLQRLAQNAPGFTLPASKEPDDLADSICACARLLVHPETNEESLLLALSYALLQIAAAADRTVLSMSFTDFRLRMTGALLELEARALLDETASPRLWQTIARRAALAHEAYREHTGKPLFILFPSSHTQALLMLCGRLSDGKTPVERTKIQMLQRLFRACRNRDGKIIRTDDEIRDAIEEDALRQGVVLRQHGLVRVSLGTHSLILSTN